MPLPLILLLAVIVGAFAWLGAWWNSRRRPETRRAEIQRLNNHALWLEQRLDVARRERWDPEMIKSLSTQLGAACQTLARLQRGKRQSFEARRGTQYHR
jgi:hypothetical protein